jgi:hypothetical protein
MFAGSFLTIMGAILMGCSGGGSGGSPAALSGETPSIEIHEIDNFGQTLAIDDSIIEAIDLTFSVTNVGDIPLRWYFSCDVSCPPGNSGVISLETDFKTVSESIDSSSGTITFIGDYSGPNDKNIDFENMSDLGLTCRLSDAAGNGVFDITNAKFRIAVIENPVITTSSTNYTVN